MPELNQRTEQNSLSYLVCWCHYPVHQLIKIHCRVNWPILSLQKACVPFPATDNAMMSEKPIHNFKPQSQKNFRLRDTSLSEGMGCIAL
jgi:hypothetical protein